MNFRIRQDDRRQYDRRQKIIPERGRRDSLDRRSNREHRVTIDRRWVRAIIKEGI